MSRGKLILVGAGPGDPELITLKGVRKLAEADVVLYDALSNTELLEHAALAEHVFVGKKPGVHRSQQSEINRLILEYVEDGKVVVRLKGGDSYVFGRGHEEVMFIAEKGFSSEVIPGVSSFYSVPELIGLPLTRRGLSESFWVLTGTTKDLELAKDLRRAAESEATVVVLMGMSQLPKIVQIFEEVGKEDLPVAVIQEGSTENQNVGVGTVNSIVGIVEEKNLQSPAIIVLGKVATLINNARTN